VPALLSAAGVGALWSLTKPRLAAFSIFTAIAAYLAESDELRLRHLAVFVAGTALAAGGALSLNQWWERDSDARMERTRGRPLPAGRILPRHALAWSLVLSVSGVAALLYGVSPAAASVAGAIIVLYGAIYTPLKRRSRWATEVGAVPGALPPLIGAAAAGSLAAPAGWTLVLILFLWQMPHFFAIGWLHRDDYRRAGFPLLPAVDTDGGRTARWSFGYSLALVPGSMLPWMLERAGTVFAVATAAAGLAMLVAAAGFLRARDNRRAAARRLFLASIVYLPLVLAALLLDRACSP
jgi:protoheme IX farnesyltransferase